MTQSRTRRKGISDEEMHQQYPSLKSLAAPSSVATRRAWVAVFNVRPDAMHALLADFIKQVHAQPGRIGQRPMPREAEVDFEGLLYGEDNTLSMTEVLPKLMERANLSERAMVKLLFMARTQFQRLLRGEYHPDANEIRHIAMAVGVSPVFFVEYRKIMAVAAFLNLIEERPGIATLLYRRYLEIRIKS